MHPTEASMKLARLSGEATANYASAAFAAYAEMAAQGMSMWLGAIDAMVPKATEPEPRSWYRTPDQRRAGATPFRYPYGTAGRSAASYRAPLPFANPYEFWQSWMRMWPLQGPPASWPMAYMMIHSGLPRDVAYPAAAANVAVMEAVGTASQLAVETFASYHSDSGYASAQLRYRR